MTGRPPQAVATARSRLMAWSVAGLAVHRKAIQYRDGPLGPPYRWRRNSNSPSSLEGRATPEVRGGGEETDSSQARNERRRINV